MKTTRLIVYGISLLTVAAIALGSQFMTPHQTMVIEGDISLSYPVNNTVPYIMYSLFTDRTLPWLVIFFVVPFIGILVLFASTEKRTQWNVHLLLSYQVDPSSCLFHDPSLLYQ